MNFTTNLTNFYSTSFCCSCSSWLIILYANNTATDTANDIESENHTEITASYAEKKSLPRG